MNSMTNVEKTNVEVIRKPMAVFRSRGVLREATTGRAVLHGMQAAEDVLYNLPAPAALSTSDGRRARSCRGLTLVKSAAAPVVATPEEVRPLAAAAIVGGASPARPRPQLAFYRKYTVAMLRRYVRMSTEAGRTPSLLGREMFRARVTSCRMESFEDVVNFCIDVERCIAKLTAQEQRFIKRIALQEYSFAEAAGILGLSLRHTLLRYNLAVDRLTGLFLAAGMMEPLRKLSQAYEEGSVKE